MTCDLLINIARCLETEKARSNHNHPSYRVATAQINYPLHHESHLPEPWSGSLEKAKILCVGSNPSTDYDEDFPTAEWSDDKIRDFFENRFGSGHKVWTKQNKVLYKNGSYSRANSTWSEISNRATEILGREAVPGIDYALTETVRCKSRNAEGVKEARNKCMERHFAATLAASNARIIIALGEHARAAVGQMCLGKILGSAPVVQRTADQEKVFLAIGKAGSNKPRKLPEALPRGIDDLALIREFL